MNSTKHEEIILQVEQEPAVGEHVGSVAVAETINISLAPEGWMTSYAIAKELGVTGKVTKKVIPALIEEHPEWLQAFKNIQGHIYHHYHPELIEHLRTHYVVEPPPEGWITNKSLSDQLSCSEGAVSRIAGHHREKNPNWFGVYKGEGRGGQITTYYHPLLVEQIVSLLVSREAAPEGWTTNNTLAKELSVDFSSVKRQADSYRDDHPEWYEFYTDRTRKLSEHYHPELVSAIKHSLSVSINPDGWMTTNNLAKELGVAFNTVKNLAEYYKEKHPDWYQIYKGKGNQVTVHYHPELIARISEVLSSYEPAPTGWLQNKELSQALGVADDTAKKAASTIRGEHPEWFGVYRSPKGKLINYYHPSAVIEIQLALGSYEQPPEGWMTASSFSNKEGYVYHTVRKIAEQYADEHTDWFATYKDTQGKPTVHYHPELVETIRQHIKDKLLQKELSTKEVNLRDNFVQFIDGIASRETIKSQEFQALLQLFGPELAVDILFQYRPEYQKISLPFAKRVIGDYLGEFLVIQGDLQLDNLEKGVQYLSDPNLKQGLTEVIKNDCLRFYNQVRKEGLVHNDLLVLTDYINSLRKQTENYTTAELAEVLDEVEEYYKALFEVIQIPDNVVEELEPGRLFPDINQRINILELMDKQKMLIADEMGVGKSASAILAKESLGAKQALVVVPSNVVEVWQKYLSDYKNGDGSARGYFKDGQIPRVLTVNNGLNGLKDEDLSRYDYIIISQERLTGEYTQVLEQLDYDMLIVDEAHKLKNITSGKRAENLVKLAEKIEGDDKYLALLSGTPVPNHVSDIAMVLRLLYPEKFEGVANKDLTRQILDGDVLDLRSLLVPRMQMKSLAESVEMPNLHEELHTISMSDQERDIYEVLLEEDELTATDKLRILRQFILNPQAFEMTPGLEGSKIRAVGEALRSTFTTKNKTIMFVNGYIDGVIRGENTIFEGLNLPEDVEVHVIDGKVPKARRLEIQKMLQERSGRKMLLAVSGQTADVGVDFSGAEELYFYNEPWTEYDKRQQQGRVYRPGLKHDLVSHTFYVEGSVEEGIHKYIEYKYNAVEKLLRGIPLSELERELLKEDEKQVDPNLEVNPALAEHYLSSWHRMLKIYNHVKEIGEPNFRKFLDKYAREYAECYTELGSRSYQANANRLAGTVIDSIAKSKNQSAEYVRILDVASGPEMLKRHIREEYQDQVVSVDINSHHFEQVDEKRRVGSFLDLPVADSTVEYANLALALHYTKFLPTKGVYERVKVFQELNRVLVNEGVAVINLMHNHDLKDNELFAQAIEKVGFEVVEGLSGEVSSADNFRSRMLVLQKVASCTQDTTVLAQQIGTPLLQGFKFAKTDVKLKDSRKIVTTFIIDGAEKVKARLNATDQYILDEEHDVLTRMKSLRRKYGSIRKIPSELIYQSGLARAFTGKTYVLFKSLDTGNGAVITR